MSRLPVDPDPDAAMREHPRWAFGRDGDDWVAYERSGLATLRGKSLESLEGKVTRAERAWGAVADAAGRLVS